MHEHWRHVLLGHWARLVARRPKAILGVAGLGVLTGVVLAVTLLGFEPDRNALISDELEWNRRFIDWRNHFQGTSDLFVVVDLGQPDPPEALRQAGRSAVDDLARQLQASEFTERVEWGFDRAAFSPSTIRMLSMENGNEFAAAVDQLRESETLLRSNTPAELLKNISARMTRELTERLTSQAAGPEALETARQRIDELTALIDAMRRVLAEDAAGNPFTTLETSDFQYMVSDNGRMYFLRVRPREKTNALASLEPAIRGIRQVIGQVAADHRDVEIGVTGIQVVETDETHAATRDSIMASVLALLLIGALLVTAYHSYHKPIMLMIALLTGIAWTFGFLTLAVGHLQVISVVFTAVLLGIGIAFGVHVASTFELCRHHHPDTVEGFEHALTETLEKVGPGVVTGAMTTAAAFATTLLTEFRGVAEMGLIAAAGIVLCLLSMFSVYPALLRLFKHRHHHIKTMGQRRVHLFDEKWVMPFARRPRATIVAALLIFLAATFLASRLKFDYDLMALLPRGVESVDWQRRIARDSGESIWSAVVLVDDMDEARTMTRRLRSLPVVSQVTGVGMLVPRQERKKLARLAEVREELSGPIDQALAGDGGSGVETPDLRAQLAGLSQLIGMASIRSEIEPVRPAIQRLGETVQRTLNALTTLSPGPRRERLERLREVFGQWRHATAQRVAAAVSTESLTLDDVPDALLGPYVGDDGRLALEVHPRLPSNGAVAVTSPLDPRFLPRFVESVREVAPGATGVICQIYDSGRLIRESYVHAGLYALLAVFVIVWIDFRSARDAATSLIPVAVGFSMTFAILYLLGMSINPANIIVLPLMFGIGVDAGVHVLHRFRMDRTVRPLGLTAGTGKGITITSLTTMFGFGSMMIASHRGMASLGFTLALGVGLTLLACWGIMPAWLEIRERSPKVGRRKHVTNSAEG